MKKKILIIAAIVVAISVIGGGGYYLWSSSNNYVAQINGEKISKAEYNFFLELTRSDMEQTVSMTGGDVAAFWNSKIDGEDAKVVAKNKALEEAQKFKIQQIKAKESNIQFTKEEKDNLENTFSQQVKQYGRTEMEKQIKDTYNMTLSQYKDIFMDASLISKFADEEIKKMEAPEEELKKFYDENASSFEQVTARHVLLKTVDDSFNPLPEEQVKEKEKTANEVLEKLRSGTDMGTLAKEYSEDEGSKDNSGEYTFPKGQMMPEFEEWAFNAKEGDTGIVETDYGYHVMQFVKKLGFEDVKDQVTLYFKQSKYSDSIEEWVKDPSYNVIKNQKVFDSIVAL